MMNLSNFICLFVLSLVLISVQSSNSNSQQFGNETLRRITFDWEPYVCKVEEAEKLKIDYVIIQKDKLYFYFQEYVVRIKLVEMYGNFLRRHKEYDREYEFLIYGDFEYAPYSEMEEMPSILTHGHISGFFHVDTEEGWVTYSLTPSRNNRVDRLEYSIRIAGQLANKREELYKWWHGKNSDYSVAFTRWDNKKWWEITYKSNRYGNVVYFDLFSGYDFIGETYEKINYQVVTATYYELEQISKINSLNNFTGQLVVADQEGQVHLHRFNFSVRPNDMKPTKKELYISDRSYFIMKFSEFFGCKIEKTSFEEREIKGIYFSSDTHLFYIFINNYYLKGEYDLVSSNFRIVNPVESIRQAKRIKFIDGDPDFEKISIKYVKQTRCGSYLTVNPYQTYSLEFENGERGGIGQIVAKKMNNKSAHKCPDQILSFANHIFCFEKTVYYWASNNNLENYMDHEHMFAIDPIFYNANITLDANERLEFITNYTPGFHPSILGDFVLFVFAKRFFKVHRRFIAMKELRLPNTFHFIVVFKTERLDFQVTEYTNCLFVTNENCNPEPVKVYGHFNGSRSDTDYGEDDELKNKEFDRIEDEQKSPKPESGSSIIWPSLGILFLIFSFVAGLLLLKSSSKFGRKSTEAKLDQSKKLASKSDDSTLNKLKKERKRVGKN